MRICIITKYIPPISTDGIPRNRWDYARQFTALGHEVHIVTSGSTSSERIEQGIFIHQVNESEKHDYTHLFSDLNLPGHVVMHLAYSHLVYLRIKKLNEAYPIHVIESPLWDIEGYLTRLALPEIPFVVRLETTVMLLREILSGKTPERDLLNEIEAHFLQIATAYVFDSWSILLETARLYKVDFAKKPYAVVYHGIDLAGIEQDVTIRAELPGKKFKLLSVGRFEKRKGSDILVKEIIPKLLAADKNIEIHLVGKDNGEWDGFKDEHGMLYHDYIRKEFKPWLNSQVFLYGYVSDEKLNTLYQEADAVLALSRYESFGLLYLEAMRKAKPLIVFNTGAVPEIFDDGKDAIVLPLDQPEKVVEAVERLRNDPTLRHSLGSNALEKLLARFSAERMGKECADFFEELVFKEDQTRLLQVMNALTDRDGVSNITIDYDRLLREAGEPTQILGSSATPAVKHLVKPIESVSFVESDIVLYHYWNHCERAGFFNKLILPAKVLVFHNITTPSFFREQDAAFQTTSMGFKQLPQLSGFDVYAAFSDYSLNILRQCFDKPITTWLLPPLIDRASILQRPYNESLVKSKGKSLFHILFVGSVAPHKKQTDLVRFFHYYSRTLHLDSHLTLVGGGPEHYMNELKELVKDLKLQHNVTITGKVSDEDLYAYYRTADLYLSMSEHEGFGVPLAEAMVFDIPVVAFNSTAILDTVGDNGCIFLRKEPDQVGKLVEEVRINLAWRKRVLERQAVQLEKFSRKNVLDSFNGLIKLAKEKHFERISRIKSQPDYQVEDIFYYNDKRLDYDGTPRFLDDQFLVVENGNSVMVKDNFTRVQCSFLAHRWGGKVYICVDDGPAAEYDLFSSGREIRTIELPEFYSGGPHRLRIWKSDNRHSFSQGDDALLHMVRLLKPYHDARADRSVGSVAPVIPPAQAIEPPIAGPASTEPEPPGQLPAADTNPNTGVFRSITEITAMSADFTFSDNWVTRDGSFKFSDGSSGKHTIRFKKEFSDLQFQFVSHPWSGKVEISVDGNHREKLDLYSPEHGLNSFRLQRSFPKKQHEVTITTLFENNPSSKGYEVFFGSILIHEEQTVNISQDELASRYSVSVIINTLDRAEHLEKLFKALERQTYPHFEIVVVNGPSKDRTMEVLAGYQGRIKVAHCPEANLSWSRNIGIEQAAGKYVAFIDDDALPCDEHWIGNFIYYAISKGGKGTASIGAIGGPVKHRDTEHYEFRNGATSDYAFQAFRQDDLNGHALDGKRWVERVPGGNAIMLKSALYDIGGFDEKFVYYLDETDVCIQLARKGYLIANNPINFIRHYKAPSKVRKSEYDIRWDIIARSDTYFALKNGFDALPIRLWKTLRYFRKKHFFREVNDAYQNGKISKDEFRKYRGLLKSGFYEGLKWGIKQQKRAPLHNPESPFLLFPAKV